MANKSLTVDDALDVIWAHVFDIASTATPKGSARMTVRMTVSDVDGSIKPIYQVITMLDGKGKVTNFIQGELDPAVTLYNSIVQWL